MRPNTTRSLAAVAASLIILGTLSEASARPRYRQPTRDHVQRTTRTTGRGDQGVQQRLSTFIQQNQLKTFTKHGKKFIATQRNTNIKPLHNLGKNVVEFFVRPGFHHLYTRVPTACGGADLKQHVYSRITGLSKSGWYPSSSEHVGVLVQLTDREMSNLQDFLGRATANPSQVIGRFVYGGGRPPTASNCTSYITTAKIGERGESFARLLGVWESGMPQSFLRSLINSGNDRVKAVVVQNPASNFDQNYNLSHALR